MAGKFGNICIECFRKLPKLEKEQIGREAAKLKFWAKSGYYIFIFFLIIVVLSFSLSFLNIMLFFLGIVFVVIDFIYGYLLYNYLSQVNKR